jgi:hypothetical protein
MRNFILTGIALVAVAAGVARSQESVSKPDMHAMMADQHKMMMSMQASNKKLDDLIAQLNSAKGNDRVDKLVAVVNELAAERKQTMNMMSMHGGMMQQMMNK